MCGSGPPQKIDTMGPDSDMKTSGLVEDVDAATRDVYHALRTALHKLEDLQMRVIRGPDAKPFGKEHDKMYKMYLDLSARFQATREEMCDYGSPATDGPRTVELPVQRSEGQPHVAVPVGSVISSPYIV